MLKDGDVNSSVEAFLKELQTAFDAGWVVPDESTEEQQKEHEKQQKALLNTVGKLKHAQQVYILSQLVKPALHIGSHSHSDTITEGMLRGGSFANRAGPGKSLPGFYVMQHVSEGAGQGSAAASEAEVKYTVYVKAAQFNQVNLPIGLPVMVRLPKDMELNNTNKKSGSAAAPVVAAPPVTTPLLVGHTGVDYSMETLPATLGRNDNVEWGLCLAYQGSPVSKPNDFFKIGGKHQKSAKALKFAQKMRAQNRLVKKDGESHIIGYPSWSHMKKLLSNAVGNQRFIVHANDDGTDLTTHTTYVRSMLEGGENHGWLRDTMKWFSEAAKNQATWRWQVNLTCRPVANDNGKERKSKLPLLEDPKSAENLAEFISTDDDIVKDWRFILPIESHQVPQIVAETLFHLFRKDPQYLNRVDIFQDPSAGAGVAQSASSYLSIEEVFAQVVELVRESEHVKFTDEDLAAFIAALDNSSIGFGATGGLHVEDGKEAVQSKFQQWADKFRQQGADGKPHQRLIWTDWQTGARHPTTIDPKNPLATANSKSSRNRYYGAMDMQAMETLTRWAAEVKTGKDALVFESSHSAAQLGNELALVTLSGMDDSFTLSEQDLVAQLALDKPDWAAVSGRDKAEVGVLLTKKNFVDKKDDDTVLNAGVPSFTMVTEILGNPSIKNVALQLEGGKGSLLENYFGEKKLVADAFNLARLLQELLATNIDINAARNGPKSVRIHLANLDLGKTDATALYAFLRHMYEFEAKMAANEQLTLRFVLPAVDVGNQFGSTAPKVPKLVGQVMQKIMSAARTENNQKGGNEQEQNGTGAALLHRLDLVQALPLFRREFGFVNDRTTGKFVRDAGAVYLTPQELKAHLLDNFGIPLGVLEGVSP